MWTRREILKRSAQAGALFALPTGCGALRTDGEHGVDVNDMQSQLNATRVRRIVSPRSLDDVAVAVRDAVRDDLPICVAGGRHAMGGQQFCEDGVLVDMTGLDRIVQFDRERGLVEVQAGIEWPRLIDALAREQEGSATPWAIRQKQTGVDRVSLGGSLASNIHGRGLRFPPIVGDVESFTMVDAAGKTRVCSRTENAELFALAIGGYGMFGIITHVTLRLVPRTKVQRVVEVIAVKDLLPRIDERLAAGFLYGDCQYSPDLQTDATTHAGVFSCYRPVALDTPVSPTQKALSRDDWATLYRLARTDKKQAFERYASYYVATSGQVYGSDTHQLAGTLDGYRTAVDASRGTEMITEVYVRRDRFVDLLARCRADFVEHGCDVTYGTIRFIERDDETFLAWAREPYVCIVCNLHVTHTPAGIAKATADFRRIIDRAIEHGGHYFLTYHRWATREQVEACYPRFVEFLRLKKKYDPHERLQSNWYRHYRELFADRM